MIEQLSQVKTESDWLFIKIPSRDCSHLLLECDYRLRKPHRWDVIMIYTYIIGIHILGLLI